MVLDKVTTASLTNSGDYRSLLHYVATELGDFFSSALGNAMSKVIEDPQGNYIVCSDGSSLVRELSLRFRHPIITTLLDAGAVQGPRWGDLVKTTIVLACRLVVSGLALIQQGIHPNIVRNGFLAAMRVTLDLIPRYTKDYRADEPETKARLCSFLSPHLSPRVAQHIATIMSTPLAQHLERIKLDAIYFEQSVSEFHDHLGLLIHPGGNIMDSFLVDGVAVIKAPLSWGANFDATSFGSRKEFRLAMVSGELYHVKKQHDNMEFMFLAEDAKYGFKDSFDAAWIRKASILKSLRIDVLVTEKGVDDALVSALGRAEPPIIVFQRAKGDEMKRVADHASARIVHDLDHLEASDVGTVTSIKVQRFRSDIGFIFSSEKDRAYHTLVIKGSTYDICDAVKHLLVAAIRSEHAAACGGMVHSFPGVLAWLARDSVSIITNTCKGKDHLASELYAESLTTIPRIFHVNRGNDWFDPIEAATSYSVVPVTSMQSMLTLATWTAIRLLRVEQMLMHPLGWQKRSGQKGEEAKNEPVHVQD